MPLENKTETASDAVISADLKERSILTAKEVAQELRCSKSQVYNLLKGKVPGLSMMPHLALGRKKVVPRATLESWKIQNISGMIPGDSEKNVVDAVH